MFDSGDVVVVDFPSVPGGKRRPAVVLSSATYHASRPDIVVGLITSRTAATDCLLEDWSAAGLKLPSAFRSFFVTLPATSGARLIGRLSDRDWDEVRQRVKLALGALQGT